MSFLIVVVMGCVCGIDVHLLICDEAQGPLPTLIFPRSSLPFSLKGLSLFYDQSMRALHFLELMAKESFALCPPPAQQLSPILRLQP
jgi:hypothetical protein